MTGERRRPLFGLLSAQALGAFNDNAWKFLVTLLAIRAIEASGPKPWASVEELSQQRTTLIFVVFTLPFLLFSIPAGALADRLSKRAIIVSMKALEVALMAAGTALLFFDADGWQLPVAVVGLMGAQSALFSPAKYGILPELVRHERLSRGNAILQALTFLAIIFGTFFGAAVLDLTAGAGPWLGGLLLTGVAVAGFLTSLDVPRVAPSRTGGGVVASLLGAWRAIRADRTLWLTVLGLAWFWGISSLLGQNVLVYAKARLGFTDTGAGLLMAVFGLGVGAGSLLASLLSRRRVESGLIPLGAGLFALFTLLLGVLGDTKAASFVLVSFMGIGSGILSVPLQATLQWRAPADRRGGVIALSNLFTFTGILFGSLGAGALATAGLSSRAILLAAAALTIAGTVWALWLLPDAFLRLLLVILTHTFYRLRVVGAENIPERGGGLLVPNHVSLADGLFLIASTDRKVRFLVDRSYYQKPLLRPFMTLLGAIPVSASGGPRVVLRALREAGRYLDEGHLVCIFAEGQITRTGSLLPFRRGMERIVKGRDVPVIPVHLDRVWGSIFSRSGGRFLWKLPETIPYPVTVSFGEALPPTSSAHEVRQAVVELGELAWELRERSRRPLHRTLIAAARRHPFARTFFERGRRGVPRIRVLASAVAVARALRRDWAGQQNVGIALPPGIGGALVNAAASLSGRTSVNLNWTAGSAAVASAIRQAGLQTVVTSPRLLEKANFELPPSVRMLDLEELAGRIGPAARAGSLLLALLAPAGLLERACGAGRRVCVQDPVTIIFSSGSTGEPKGVVLTHANLDANVEGAAQVLHPDHKDTALAVLPLFHSFGYFLLWFALNHRVRMVFHANPLDAAAVGELVETQRVTILVATPTFLQLYMRRCTPGQFGSLRLVITGAERLPDALSAAFEEKFGIRPLEGYGATECSPVISVNTPGFRAPGFFQQAARRGSVGHPLPGVAIRIVDPDTGEPRPPGEAGMILVRGPNVMKEYLGREDLTRRAIRDGWYVTGDIGILDEEGFLSITDRLSRFSKIGGEMVPHGRVEEALQEASGEAHRVFAVTAVPDEKKGERLAVLHTLDESRIPGILARLEEAGLPNLFLPRRDAFVRVEDLPLLGTGKLDLQEVRRIAREALGREA